MPTTEGDHGPAISQSLEDKARQALACPCVAELREGPCGAEFSNAFLCYIKSETPDKGSDCVLPFEKMQHCMSQKSFLFSDKAVDKVPLPPEQLEDEGDSESDEEFEEYVKRPPRLPDTAVKLPLWFGKKEDVNHK